MYSGMMSTAKRSPTRAGVVNLPASAMRADVLQAVVAADRPRALAHELHAVVVRRVVARRDHDAAVHLARERREVDDLGAAEADVVDVDARVEQALLERLAELLARQADVATDDHLLRLDELRVGAADAIGDVLVQLVRDAAAQVVGLEAAGCVIGFIWSIPSRP